MKLRKLTNEEKNATQAGLNNLRKQAEDLQHEARFSTFKLDGYLDYIWKKRIKEEEKNRKEMTDQLDNTMKLIKIYEEYIKKGVPIKKEDKHEKRESKLRSKDVQSLVRRTRRKV